MKLFSRDKRPKGEKRATIKKQCACGSFEIISFENEGTDNCKKRHGGDVEYLHESE